MDYTCFNTEIATGPCPELSLPLSKDELDDLWFYCVLEFSHLLDVPVRAISSGSGPSDYSPILVPQGTQQDVIFALEHLPSNCTNHSSFNDPNDTALIPAPAISMEELTDLTARSPYTYPVSKQKLDRRHWLTLLPIGCAWWLARAPTSPM
ncbi:hypothetical protein F5888DRAFT_1689235 [Russula emetica]|jgi:hypothetical protein|nr:hypothetical protein F5888DRAFT_1689235 [Russula emetica]